MAEGQGKYNILDKLPKALDSLRIVPRMLVIGYAFLMYHVSEWFMELAAPTGTQSTFVSVMVGAAAGIFGLYVNSGKNND